MGRMHHLYGTVAQMLLDIKGQKFADTKECQTETETQSVAIMRSLQPLEQSAPAV